MPDRAADLTGPSSWEAGESLGSCWRIDWVRVGESIGFVLAAGFGGLTLGSAEGKSPQISDIPQFGSRRLQNREGHPHFFGLVERAHQR
jgi:hypothetical protein